MPEMTDAEKAQTMLAVYFRTQAAIEKFMGPQRLPEWTAFMATFTADGIRTANPEPAGQARALLGNFSRVLEVYGTDQTLTDTGDQIELKVDRCGIYDYRERAGVELTLRKPCEFCVDLRYRTAERLGLDVTHTLGERSCQWRTAVPAAAGADRPREQHEDGTP